MRVRVILKDYISRDDDDERVSCRMAVVAVPFILYLVRFCSSKSCNDDERVVDRVSA